MCVRFLTIDRQAVSSRAGENRIREMLRTYVHSILRTILRRLLLIIDDIRICKLLGDISSARSYVRGTTPLTYRHYIRQPLYLYSRVSSVVHVTYACNFDMESRQKSSIFYCTIRTGNTIDSPL